MYILICNDSCLFLDVRYEWSKFGTAAWLFPGGSYTFVSQAGYMYFSEVQPTDQKEYFCFVTLATPKNYRMNTKQPPMVINKGIWLMVIEQSKYGYTTIKLHIQGMFKMNCLFLSGDFKFQVSPKMLISCH